MQTISDFPYFEVQFGKDGSIHDNNEVSQVLDFLKQGTVSDLIVISHGWNNDMAEARSLYKNFFSKIRAEINAKTIPAIEQRKFAVLGILWPSKKFTDEELIPSGAAEFDTPLTEEEELQHQLDGLKGTFDHPDADANIERAKQLLGNLENDPNAGAELVDLLRSLPGKKREIHPDDGSDDFFSASPEKILDLLSRPDIPVSTGEEEGGAADFDTSASAPGQGGAAGFNLFGGITSAVRNVLNFTTYYQMKERAGIVGKSGAYQLLAKIRQLNTNLKIHLVGHSFGGRLVTSIADGPQGSKAIQPETMTLLQAAFSHNGFANNFDGDRDGFFRKVISEKKVKGPIIITHSIKDTAVGVAYPIASKLSGADASDFNGPESRFGGIGRNGAQRTPEADNNTPLGNATTLYKFDAGKVYNLRADNIIMGHSDITRAEVAHAMLSAVAAT